MPPGSFHVQVPSESQPQFQLQCVTASSTAPNYRYKVKIQVVVWSLRRVACLLAALLLC